jgi:hypothetical protein
MIRQILIKFIEKNYLTTGIIFELFVIKKALLSPPPKASGI